MNETGITAIVPRSIEESERLAGTLAKSTLLPPDLRNKPSDVLFQIMTGGALGLDPTASIRSIHIIKGKPTMSADLMVALVKRSPLCKRFKLLESTPERAEYETERDGEGVTKMAFTMAEAKAAQLVKDDSGWKKYPAAMLRARAASALCRAVYPDLLLGVYETSEADEIRSNSHAVVIERAVNEEPVAAPSSFDCSPLLKAIEDAPSADALKSLIPALSVVPDDAKATLRAAYNARQAALNAQEQAAEAEAANG